MDKQLKPFPFYYHRLPSFQEAHDSILERDDLDFRQFGESLFHICHEQNIFQLWNEEYISALAAKIISFIGRGLVLEVAAGDGMLSHWLREHGVNIRATDDMSWERIKAYSEVERIDAIEAIRKHQPKLVLASWIEFQSTLDVELLEEKTEFIVIIGEGNEGCTGSKEFWGAYKKKGYILEYFNEIDRFNLCRTDSSLGLSVRRHSETAFFRLVPGSLPGT